jgi:hypothetical protein
MSGSHYAYSVCTSALGSEGDNVLFNALLGEGIEGQQIAARLKQVTRTLIVDSVHARFQSDTSLECNLHLDMSAK